LGVLSKELVAYH